MNKSFITFLLMVLIAQNITAGEFSTLGSLKSMKRQGQSLEIRTTLGNAVVTVMRPDIFRIRIVKEKLGTDFSYAVVGKPQKTDFKVQQTPGLIRVSTSALVLEISTQPVRFTFKTLDGQIINQDDPALGTNWNGTEVTTCKTLFKDEKFIGLGEKSGNLDRRGAAYWHWNTDNPRYDNNSDPLYSTIPFYIGLHSGLVYGIYFDNTHKSYFNFGASQERFSSFGADDGEMDYYFIGGQKVADIIEGYTWLTGRMPMPPLWALGNQQCRWSYYPDEEVLNIAQTFRKKRIPADVIYLDIHYMDAYKVFTWHPERFSQPAKLLGDLKEMGFHTTVIIDPGIKVEKGYHAYEDGLKNDVFIKYPDGQPYQGQVWPGWCYFTDYTQPKAREWWGSQFKGLIKDGVEGFWNDMNEIATWGQATPTFIQFDWEGQGATYRKAKNIYGMLMARSTYEGTKALMNRRPLVLTRAGFAGLQRYTAIWTGDNQANDDHMLLGVRLVNSFGLSGVPFNGYDIGGFGGDATPALYARWISLGALSPFCRTHSAFNTKDSEPWAYGEDVEDIARNYINFRYRLMPYLYSLFREASQTGLPVQRTLAIEYSQDPRTFYYVYQNQYTLGASLLVAPCKSTEELTRVFLPEGQWYRVYDDQLWEGGTEILTEAPLHRLPIFVKAGSIIPVWPVLQNTGEDPGDILEIHIYKGKGVHRFTYYEDDGQTFDYQEGKYYEREITYDGDKNTLNLSPQKGKYTSRFKSLKIVLHGYSGMEGVREGMKGEKSTEKSSILPEGFGYSKENPWFEFSLKDDEINLNF
ncbi:MAG: TIM-barrel domain-containing protein [Bacteroidales bacterium]